MSLAKRTGAPHASNKSESLTSCRRCCRKSIAMLKSFLCTHMTQSEKRESEKVLNEDIKRLRNDLLFTKRTI
jgi:hypothetical protein